MNTGTESARPAFWRRLGAYLIDSVSLMIALAVLQYLLAWLTRGRLQAVLFQTNNPWLSYSYVLLTVSWVPFNLYFSTLESSRWQATPGKRWLKIKVADTRGNRIGLGRALLRTTLKFLPWELGHVSFMLLTRVTVTGLTPEADFAFSPATQFVTAETPWATPVRVLAFILLGAYVLSILFHRQGRGLYDLLAGTAVVRSDSSFVQRL